MISKSPRPPICRGSSETVVSPVSSMISIEGEDVGDGKNKGVFCLVAGCWLLDEFCREVDDCRAMTLFDTTFVAGTSIGGVTGNVAIAGTESDLTRSLRLGRACLGPADDDAKGDGGSSTKGRTRGLEGVRFDFDPGCSTV
jgi:hypothetical protein